MTHSEPLKRVNQFKYLGRIVSWDDNDSLAVRQNVKRAPRV